MIEPCLRALERCRATSSTRAHCIARLREDQQHSVEPQDTGVSHGVQSRSGMSAPWP